MPEINKDQNIRLFGRTISLPRNNTTNDSSLLPHEDHSPPSSSSSPREVISATTEHEAEDDKEPSTKELTSVQDDEATLQTTEDLKSPTSSCIDENPKTPSAERETSLAKPSKNGEQSETSVSQDKTPKKPDKILPCPRCNSMDTKFCYYNNYNVNQPRHFCKKCQRYWTAGGTMRNVPVGAGRRKNKNALSSASHYHQIMVPEALQAAKLNGLHNGMLGNGAAVLTFGSDSSPLCDSMASVLSLAEKTQNGVVLNGFHGPKQNVFVSNGKEENNNNNDDNDNDNNEKKDHGGSSHESVDKCYQGFPPQLPCFQGSSSASSSPWPYPWNPSMPPPPAFYQPSYPVSFYPTPAYWGVNVMPPPSWSLHPISPQSNSTNGSNPNSPTLGKHSREGNILSPTNSMKEKPATESRKNNSNNNSENSVLIPKTLRIDDPGDAAKSSIWSTLGIKNEGGGGGGIFKAFPSKGGDKNHVAEASPALHANPAALSRSLIFHERT
ncbi:hypothetical protein RIF29_15950 [Crotalaria pallida]|uniref:Dof-type domain-containing protein n=1 Tax=Crotalaria pallida TaxID=3830 RepID=A0AAN9FGD2_CROPI